MKKEQNGMTKEFLQEELERLQKQRQDDFINKLNEQVELLTEKANKKDYELTINEKQKIGNMIKLLTWIDKNC